MGSDVSLTIVDPRTGAVMQQAWIGMREVIDRAREVLRRALDFTERGWESWGRVTEHEMLAIAEMHYADGLDAEVVARWAVRYPTSEYWWLLDHDF